MPILNKRANKTPLGLYVHVPFCRSKCQYCDFYSMATKDDKLMDGYLDAVCDHIKEAGELAPGYKVDSVYFGGGTPSFFGADGLAVILTTIRRNFDVVPDAEISVECNPDSVSDRLLHRLYAEGFNRVSLGVQSDDDEILKKLSLKSSEGGFKITIVWLPEKLHPVCANKLLKLLEEPPEKTVFLLVSEAPDMILPTILSRTQRMNVRKIDKASIDRGLQTKYNILPADSISIAHLANGNFIKALETIHLNEENQLFFDLFVSLMRLSYQRKIKEMKMWSEQVAGMGRERQKNFLEYCQRMIRENFIFNLHQRNLTYMTINEQNFATRFAPFVNERNVMGIMDELSEAQLHIEQNVNAKMVFFDFSLKMIVLLKQ
mgnify:CR=1 FL=1